MSNSDKKQLQEGSHPNRRATDKKPQKLMLTIKDVAKLLHHRSRIDDEQYEMILKRGDAQAARLNSHLPKNLAKKEIYLPELASPAQVITSFSLEIPAGQTIALVGTTGAGKSTLAKLISRFYDPTEGVVKLDDTDLRDISNGDLRREIVMVTQEAYLFTGSVAENIQLGKPGASMEEVEQAAKAVGAHDFILKLPNGYDTDVNKRGGRVSSGQRQLISFARAFLANPAVLILDEATSSLDIPSEAMVQKGLKTLLSGRTAVIIAHRLSTVAIADRVLVMEHGSIIEDGTPEQLVAAGGKFSKLYKAWRESLV